MHCCTLDPSETTRPFSEPVSGHPTTLQSVSPSVGTPTFQLFTRPGPAGTTSPEAVGPPVPTQFATTFRIAGTNPSTTAFIHLVPFGIPASDVPSTKSTLPTGQGHEPSEVFTTTTTHNKDLMIPAETDDPVRDRTPTIPRGAPGIASATGAPGSPGPAGRIGPSGPYGPPGPSGRGGPSGSYGPDGPAGQGGPSGDVGSPGVYGPGDDYGPDKFVPHGFKHPGYNGNYDFTGEALDQPLDTPKTGSSTQRPSTVSKAESVQSLSTVISNGAVRKSSPMMPKTTDPVKVGV